MSNRVYLKPHNVNSNVWFYKIGKRFEFYIRGFGSFRVQDRTLLSYIKGTRKP